MSKIIELVLLFVSVFSVGFNLICYFANLSLFSNSLIHLIIAIVCIAIMVAILVVFFKENEDSDDEQELEDEEKIETSEEESEAVEEISKEFEHLDQQETIVEEQETQNNEFNEEDDIVQIDNKPLVKNVIQQQDNTVEENIEQEAKPLDAKVDLTKTQIMYINNSDNSYINDEGLPQLVVTKEINSSKVNSAYSKKLEDEKERAKQLELEEQQYLQEEKEERVVDILSKVLTIIVVANVVLLVYYLYKRFF